MELLKARVQDYRDAFKRSLKLKRDQEVFLCVHMCDFLHGLLRRVVQRCDLPDELEWVESALFDFNEEELFGNPDFMQKN